MKSHPMPKVEEAIAWAAQQGYCFAAEAARELGSITNREMYCDQPQYNAYAWRDVGAAS